MNVPAAAPAPEHPASINMIVGGDDFLAERRRQGIVEQARAASGDPNLPVEMRKASELSAPELAELLSPSLFAEDRIVVVTGVEDTGKEIIGLLEQAIKDPADGVVLIIVHTGKGRNKKLVDSWPKLGAVVFQAGELKGREQLAFIDQEFRSQGARVTRETCELLLDVVGSDLRQLASAISQLIADTDGQVDATAVKRYYQGKAEVSGFEVADYAIAGNVRAAVALARRALQLGVAPVLLASALSSAVADIAKVAGVGNINSRRDAAKFGMAPWKLDKTIRTARRWTTPMIAQAVQITANLDAGVKGHSADPDYAVEDAVRQIAHIAGRR